MKKHLKNVLRIAIVVITIAAFTYYAVNHPETIDQLTQLPLALLLGLLAAYAVMFFAYALVTRGQLDMFGKTLSGQENLLFNAYSSIINFFGPGQSGPVFRAAYLKKRHELPIKQFMFSTLLYFTFYGVISLLIIGVGVLVWWQTALIVLGAIATCIGAMRLYSKKSKYALRIPGRSIAWIGVATLAQVMVFVCIYGAELRSIDPSITWGQVLAYTGVANLTLFVSLTPGGIGIRESFLFISQGLHNIPDTTIVAASIIDRGVYLVFLGILSVLVISMHAKDKLLAYQAKGQ